MLFIYDIYLHKYFLNETINSLRCELSLSWTVHVRIMSYTTSASQSDVLHATATPPHLGICWKCQFSDWPPFLLNWKFWMLGPSDQCFSKPSRLFWCTLKLSSPGEGNGNLLQYSCLENSMDRGAWWVTVHGVTRVRHDLMTKPQSLRVHIVETL